jgi:hypothetical protein
VLRPKTRLRASGADVAQVEGLAGQQSEGQASAQDLAAAFAE